MNTIKIELTITQCAQFQQLLDIAVQREGLRVADVALQLNKLVTEAVAEARKEAKAAA